jgi:hypothetical protein
MAFIVFMIFHFAYNKTTYNTPCQQAKAGKQQQLFGKAGIFGGNYSHLFANHSRFADIGRHNTC